MARRIAWKVASAVLLMCAATVGALRAQTTLANFDATDGSVPYSSLVQGSDGDLYGSTSEGGQFSGGTLFKVTLTGTLTTIYNFCAQHDCADGKEPLAGPILATDGNFYGTTYAGGINDEGTIFRITPAGALTTISLTSASGENPAAALVEATDGDFYGTTSAGGTHGDGTVFKVSKGGVLTTLHNFIGTDGTAPYASLIQAIDGNFYGTTLDGGSSPCLCGTIFKMTPTGKLTTLYEFNRADGSSTFPRGALLQAANGDFYGTTSNLGSVFMMTSEGALTTLYSFCSEDFCTDGSNPLAGLIQATDANFYGTTANGGGRFCDSDGNGCGTAFEFGLAGLTEVGAFNIANGEYPSGALYQATDGDFYGTTAAGGNNGDGTIFRLPIDLGPFVSFVHSSGKVGQTGGILGQGFTGTTSVSLNGTPASFTVVSDTFINATVPPGATTGFVTVTTPSGTLTSNVPFRVLP